MNNAEFTDQKEELCRLRNIFFDFLSHLFTTFSPLQWLPERIWSDWTYNFLKLVQILEMRVPDPINHLVTVVISFHIEFIKSDSLLTFHIVWEQEEGGGRRLRKGFDSLSQIKYLKPNIFRTRCVNLWYFKLWLFDRTEFIVWNI